MDKKNSGGRVVAHDATTHTAIVLTLALVLGVIGFLAAGSVARSASEKSGSVSLRTTKLGPVLVNAKGHTLYMFAKYKNGKISCNGSCVKFWPP